MTKTHRRAHGFTLIELVVVLAVVSILANMGYSAFRHQVMRARRTEAIVGLEAIQRAQQAQRSEFGRYADTFDEIGFSLDGGTRVDARTIQGSTYTFTLRAVTRNGDPRGSFEALATGDLDPGDGVFDILAIMDTPLPPP